MGRISALTELTNVAVDDYLVVLDTSANIAKKVSVANFNQSVLPAGIVSPYGGTTEPTGWLFCYGQAVNRVTYAALFSAIGTTYGVGDGSTTFNLPDLRGRTVAGKDDMGGSSANRLTDQSGGLNGDTLGATGGAETHTLTTAQIPAHSHSVGVQASGGAGGWTTPLGGNGAANHTYPSNAEGGGGAHNNVQPTIILNYIIKT